MKASFYLRLSFGLQLSTSLLGLCLLGTPLMGQITIPETELTDKFGKIYREVLYETNLNIDAQLATIINAKGANQTWDFTNLNYVDSTVTFEEYQLVDPNDPNLNNPNLAASTFTRKLTVLPVAGGNPDTTHQIQYCTLDNGTWTVNGAISLVDLDMDGTIDSFLQWFSPPRLEVIYPVSANSEWQDSTSIVQNLMGMEVVSSIKIDTNRVEGWGTLITPAGTADALRVHNKEITRVPGSTINDESNDLDFVSQNTAITASIVLEDGRAFYSRRSEVGSSTGIRDIPQFSFHLAQNYPNPFRDQTTVAFSLDKPSRVQLRVLNLQGQLIAHLAEGAFGAGEHHLPWAASRIAAGTYLLEMRVGQQVQHRKLTVL